MQLWFSYINLHFPYIGIEVVENGDNWIIAKYDKNGIGFQTGVELGDKILKIDGQETEKHFTVNKWGQIEQANQLLIERNGQVLVVDFDYHDNTLYSHYIIPFIMGIFSFGIFVFLVIKAFQYKSAFYLALVFLMIGLILISQGASARGDVVGKFIVNSGVTLFPILFLHFILVFLGGKRDSLFSLKWLKYLYGVFLLFFFIHFSYFIPIPYYVYFNYDRLLTLIVFTAGILLNIVILLTTYIQSRHKNPYLYANLKIIWFTLALSFLPMISLSVVPDIINGSYLIDYIYTQGFILLFPVSFLYLIFSKRLYDIQMLFNHSVYILLLSFVPAVLVTGIVFILTYQDLRFSQYLLLFCMVLLVMTLFFYVQDHFHERVEAILFPKKHRLRTVFETMVKNMGTIRSFAEIEENILRKLIPIFRVEGAAVLLQNNDGTEMICHGSIKKAELEQLIPVEAGEQNEFIIFPIHQDRGFSSFLLLTNKIDKTRFSKEEERWIYWLNSYLFVLLENLYLMQKLTMKVTELVQRRSNDQENQDVLWLKKVLYHSQDQERERIAAEIHDTAIQDIYFAKQQIGLLQEQYVKHDVDETETSGKLADIIEHLDLINYGLRDTCFQLYPHTLPEAGLVNSLRTLFQTEKMRVPFKIHLQVDDQNKNKLEALDLKKKHYLFRIVQELLTNAKKHSQATEVYFIFKLERYHCYLEYIDNGIGFPVDELSDERSKSSGMGLMQIRNRLLSLNGQIDIRSDSSEGVYMKMEIPINTDEGSSKGNEEVKTDEARVG
ncbi:ATP-binding protein [Bacillaceae bacterium IKA-2]|nr:ATP-binding protein [Bacillaceae bacterium IKA-2]